MRNFTFFVLALSCSFGYSQKVEKHESDYRREGSIIVVSENADDSSTSWKGKAMPVQLAADDEINKDAVLFYNGPYWNVQGNPKKSLLESLTTNMNSIGSLASVTTGHTVADDIVLEFDAEVKSIELFAYQTGAEVPSITGAYVQIWDGNPSDPNSNVVWGDLTTNVLSEVVYSNVNRVTENEPDDTSRQIQKVKVLTPNLNLTAGTYWMEYNFEGSSTSGPWVPPIVILGETVTGNAIQKQLIENQIMWVLVRDSGTETQQGLPFILYGDVTGGNTFPDPYCSVDFISVEPITFVEVANISNRSNAEVEVNPSHEDFTAIIGNMEEGKTYEIALEGNNNGEHPSTFTVFFDWNQDGVFDNGNERYEIGSVYDSTGEDGKQATGSIVVPEGVAHGMTRMRVIKMLGTDYAVDACTGLGWGQAEDYTIDVVATGVNAPFPKPYCGPIEFNLAVEPITLVKVADIDNATSATINGTPAHEDFTSIVGNMIAGEAYPITVKGNTARYTNSITVFIDWNQDEEFDTETERYNVGILVESTGLDNKEANSVIEVPEDAKEGVTRMRVMKRYTSSGDAYAESGCNAVSNYGQAEEYSINVTKSNLGVKDNVIKQFAYYPNPTSGDLYLKSNDKIEFVTMYNMLGQKVLNQKVDSNEVVLNLSGLNAGNYVMQVSINGKLESHKIMKR